MSKQCLSVLLSCALLLPLLAPHVAAQVTPDKEAIRVATIKAEIAKLGTGPNARINVKLRDKTKHSGYVSRTDETSFVIADAKTGATTTVPYADVDEAKGKNAPLGVKIAVTAGIVVGAVFLMFFLIYAITYRD